MSAFLTELDTKDRSSEPPQKIRFQLLSNLTYKSDVAGKIVTAPPGFVTDFASIPQVLWNILPPIGGYDEAAVIHDYLYRYGGVTRSIADKVLREAMGVLGVTAWKKHAIYAGVRLGGWAFFKGK